MATTAPLTDTAKMAALHAVQGATSVKKVTASPSLNEDVTEYFYGNNAVPADAQTTRTVTDIFGEYNKKLPEIGRLATPPTAEIRVATETRVYVTDDPKVNMFSQTFQSKDGKHAVETLIITKGALEMMKSDPEAFKACIAHEHAHHVFKMNPELANDPLFQPKSPESAAETQRLNFAVRVDMEQRLADQKKMCERYNIPWTPEVEAAARAQDKELADAMNSYGANRYHGEVIADKMGLWFNPDLAGAQRLQIILANNYPASSGQDPSQATAASDKSIETSLDPHPSHSARMAENIVTMDEINKAAEKNKTVHNVASHGAPLHTPKVPAAGRTATTLSH